MTERVNLVDAYDNRSVVAKLVNMEERISGAETSVEASAEAAASSASAAAVSLAAAKTSEANAKASADTAAATLSNTVDLSSKQTITGAKTFAGDTTVTGQLISSGTNTLSGTTELEGTVELDSTAVATLNGKVTASNTANSLKVANHNTVLTSNDVLSAKDINTPNGDANSLVHRSGDELSIAGIKGFFDLQHSYHATGDKRTWEWWGGEDSPSSLGYETIEEGDVDGEHGSIGYVRRNWTIGSDSYYSVIREFSGSNHYYRQIWIYKNDSIIYTNKFVDLSW